jgi:hypothetical protein
VRFPACIAQLTAWRTSDCTRNRPQISFLAEHTGCDGARLRAPPALHGSEEGFLLDEEGDLCTAAALRFDFACDTILVMRASSCPAAAMLLAADIKRKARCVALQTGAAARRHLAAACPPSTEQTDGAVVNVGAFACGGTALHELLQQQHAAALFD